MRIRNGLGLLLIMPIPLIITELIFKPLSYGYTGHGYEFPWYMIFFLIGYVCIITKDEYYTAIEKIRIPATLLAVISTIVFIVFVNLMGEKIDWVLNGGWLWKFSFVHNGNTFLSCIIHPLHAWFWCVTVFAWGAYLLNRPSRHISYLNQAVYPLYIVHMPFVFLGLFLLKDAGMSLFFNFISVTIFTVLGCARANR